MCEDMVEHLECEKRHLLETMNILRQEHEAYRAYKREIGNVITAVLIGMRPDFPNGFSCHQAIDAIKVGAREAESKFMKDMQFIHPPPREAVTKEPNE